MTKRFTDEAQYDPSSGHCAVVTPDDDTDLPFTTRRLEVGTPGAMTVVTERGDTVILPAMEAGHVFYLRVKRVLSTGTAADDILAVF